MDGSPAGYYYSAGSGDGAKNWLLFLMGGGWCDNVDDCQSKLNQSFGSSKFMPFTKFSEILSPDRQINPGFSWPIVTNHHSSVTPSLMAKDRNFNFVDPGFLMLLLTTFWLKGWALERMLFFLEYRQGGLRLSYIVTAFEHVSPMWAE
ncbi:uncharacterized protein LOC121746198 isoform X2 [Salvia splendens]|uniref:uncharacterized protein LOC121746198 isoform X2 n=1 Tax=Salvia splendens TaxID=180675 RepID=UPI001C2770B2|nr:uncharacterized protein LOC121746198 isoform X2 [Salvia splendens]